MPAVQVLGFDFDPDGELKSGAVGSGSDWRSLTVDYTTVTPNGHRLETVDSTTVTYDASGRVQTIPVWVRPPSPLALTVGSRARKGWGHA